MAGVQVVVQIAIAIFSAILSSYLSRTNLPQAKPASGRAPEAKDGTTIRKIYGTVWVDDSQVCAYKELTPEPIKKKAGK